MPRKPQTPEEYGDVYEPKYTESEEYQEWEPVNEDVEEEVDALPEPEPQPQPQKRKLGTGEPVLLYIEFSPRTYELFGQTFDSRIEASQYAEKEYPGAKYKVLTESEALKEAEKIEKRRQQVQHAKEIVKGGAQAGVAGLAKVGKGVLEAAYHEAKKEGLTKEQYDAKARELQLKKQKREIKQMGREPQSYPPMSRHSTFQPPEQPQRRSFPPVQPEPEPRRWGDPEQKPQPAFRPPPPKPRSQFGVPPKQQSRFQPPRGFYRPKMYGQNQQPTQGRQSTFNPNPHFRPHFAGERRRPPEQKPKPKKKTRKKNKKK